MKDAPYIPHDFNARRDFKIQNMVARYGWEGYGWFWVIVETLREMGDYKYPICAIPLLIKEVDDPGVEQFIYDCVDDFGLFDRDDEYFWSNSLHRRMAIKDQMREKRRKAAEARWQKPTKTSEKNASAMQVHDASASANAMQVQSTCNASAMQERKKERKKRACEECGEEMTGSFCRNCGARVDE